MIVNILDGLAGAEFATGLVVIVDVFRDCTTACHIASAGGRVIPVESVQGALDLKGDNPELILVGEQESAMPDGFDYGNSPCALEGADLAGKNVALATAAGTRGICVATNADEIITGSFVNANAVAQYVREKQPDMVSVVPMGTDGQFRSPEDTMCGIYIKNAIENYPNSFETLRNFFKTIPSAAMFFDPEQEYAPERDFELCMELDRFDFILKASGKDAVPELEMITVNA